MNKLGFLLLAALSATSALAGEVGAQYPQLANLNSANLAFASVDTGVSTNWTRAPVSDHASADQIAELQHLNAQIDARISEDLEQRIAEKLQLTFAN